MKKIAVFIFPYFQTLDLFGPLEMLGAFHKKFELTIVGETDAPVHSIHGQRLMVDMALGW